MFGDVDQQTDHGGWQLFPPYLPGLREILGPEAAQDFLRALETLREIPQQLLARRSGFGLEVDRRKLGLGKLLAFEIGHQPRGAPRDMPDVKPDRPEAMRAGPDLLGRKPFRVPA